MKDTARAEERFVRNTKRRQRRSEKQQKKLADAVQNAMQLVEGLRTSQME